MIKEDKSNEGDKGIVIANKDLYATEVVDIGED